MNNEQLVKRIEVLEGFIKSLQASHSIPLAVDQAFRKRFANSGLVILPVSSGGTGASSLTGILKGNGASAFTAIAPISGSATYYVALSPGGSPTAAITFTDGVLTAEA